MVRSELNRIKQQGITGRRLLEVLSKLYHVHGMERAAQRRREAPDEENNALPRIVCSEGLLTGETTLEGADG